MKHIIHLLLLPSIIIFSLMSCADDDELLSDKVLGTYFYSADTTLTDTGAAADTGRLEVILLERDSDAMSIKYSFKEVSFLDNSKREYYVDLILANLDPILVFLVPSQQNQANSNVELISGTGGYEIHLDGEKELIDGFFNISEGSVTIRYTITTAQSTRLLTLKGRKN